jgi:hypothetical protein
MNHKDAADANAIQNLAYHYTTDGYLLRLATNPSARVRPTRRRRVFVRPNGAIDWR